MATRAWLFHSPERWGVNLNIIGNMSSDEMNYEIGCLNISWPTSNPNTQMDIKSLMIKSKLQIYDIN